MAVGLEQAHAELLGQSQGLLVVGLGMGDIWGMMLCGDLTEGQQRIGLVSAFLVRMGAHQEFRSTAVRGVPRPPQNFSPSAFVNPYDVQERANDAAGVKTGTV